MTGLVKAKERLPLRVDRALGGIDVLGRLLLALLAGRVPQRAAAERDDAPLRVDHREHQAMPEPVVMPGGVRARNEEADPLPRDGEIPCLRK